MLQALYTSPLRSYLRSLGVIKLLQLPQRLRNQERAAKWRKHVGDTLKVDVAGTSIQCWVQSEFEFCRALALADDAHILKALIRSSGPGAIYWDVGANLGHYAAILAQAVGADGRVYAFEPEPRVRERLAENLSLNHLENVTIVPVGLSDHAGTATFYVADDRVAGTHSLVAQDPDGALTTIELVTGDEFVRAGNPCPNVVKIDIEGAELSAIHGMAETLRNPTLTTVVCEVHFAILKNSGQGEAPTEIKRLLHEAGLTDQVWLDSSHLIARRPTTD